MTDFGGSVFEDDEYTGGSITNPFKTFKTEPHNLVIAVAGFFLFLAALIVFFQWAVGFSDSERTKNAVKASGWFSVFGFIGIIVACTYYKLFAGSGTLYLPGAVYNKYEKTY